MALNFLYQLYDAYGGSSGNNHDKVLTCTAKVGYIHDRGLRDITYIWTDIGLHNIYTNCVINNMYAHMINRFFLV